MGKHRNLTELKSLWAERPKTKDGDISAGNAREIARIFNAIDKRSAKNRARPGMLEKFKRMVANRDEEKLLAYFRKYGINREIAKLNLDALIQEELCDLANQA